MPDIVLGYKYRDIVTGFVGIATSKTTYLNGCERVALTASGLNKDGKSIDPEFVDFDQVEFIDEGVRAKVTKKDTGGPQDRHHI